MVATQLGNGLFKLLEARQRSALCGDVGTVDDYVLD
jgi:hypothetical protein